MLSTSFAERPSSLAIVDAYSATRREWPDVYGSRASTANAVPGLSYRDAAAEGYGESHAALVDNEERDDKSSERHCGELELIQIRMAAECRIYDTTRTCRQHKLGGIKPHANCGCVANERVDDHGRDPCDEHRPW